MGPRRLTVITSRLAASSNFSASEHFFFFIFFFFPSSQRERAGKAEKAREEFPANHRLTDCLTEPPSRWGKEARQAKADDPAASWLSQLQVYCSTRILGLTD